MNLYTFLASDSGLRLGAINTLLKVFEWHLQVIIIIETDLLLWDGPSGFASERILTQFERRLELVWQLLLVTCLNLNVSQLLFFLSNLTDSNEEERRFVAENVDLNFNCWCRDSLVAAFKQLIEKFRDVLVLS